MALVRLGTERQPVWTALGSEGVSGRRRQAPGRWALRAVWSIRVLSGGSGKPLRAIGGSEDVREAAGSESLGLGSQTAQCWAPSLSL